MASGQDASAHWAACLLWYGCQLLICCCIELEAQRCFQLADRAVDDVECGSTIIFVAQIVIGLLDHAGNDVLEGLPCLRGGDQAINYLYCFDNQG